jgi:hypothetical protein
MTNDVQLKRVSIVEMSLGYFAFISCKLIMQVRNELAQRSIYEI